MSPERVNNVDQFFTSDAATFAGEYLEYLKKILDGIDRAAVARFVDTLMDARSRGATVFFIGNGGSAATASHFANDLAIGSNDYDQPFRVLSLTDNVPVMTAIGNDFGYDEVFVRQLRVLGKKGDVLVGISASGNSENLLRAFEFAATAGIRTFALTAFDGGELLRTAHDVVHVPTGPREYGPAEDAHMVLNHLVAAYIMRAVRDG